MSEYTKPLPIIAKTNREFWEGCKVGDLRLKRCEDCGQFRFPASPLCRECLSSRFTWVKSKGRGTVFSYIIYHQAFHKGFQDEIPYAVAVVDLEEGVRIISRIRNCPVDSISIGMGVSVFFEPATDEIHLPFFEPARDSTSL